MESKKQHAMKKRKEKRWDKKYVAMLLSSTPKFCVNAKL